MEILENSVTVLSVKEAEKRVILAMYNNILIILIVRAAPGFNAEDLRVTKSLFLQVQPKLL